ADLRTAGLVVEVPDDRGHPEPAGDARPLTLAPSYAVLCAAQAAVVLVPARANGRLGWAGVVLPAAALAAGIGILRAVAGGPHALALVAAVATPALAAASPRRAPAAVALWLLAWLGTGLLRELAATAVIALAAATVAELAARLAPRRALAVGLVVLAALDVVLVWGTQQVEPASQALQCRRTSASRIARTSRLRKRTFVPCCLTSSRTTPTTPRALRLRRTRTGTGPTRPAPARTATPATPA